MSKLTRVHQKIFAANAGVNQIGKFGSMATGHPAYAANLSEIQELSNYLTGWFGAVLGGNSPCIEDMNSLHYLFAYQLAYIFQQGISEWNTTATYYTGSMVNNSGYIYISKVDSNTGNAVSDSTKWEIFSNKKSYLLKSANYTITDIDEIIVCDASAGNVTITLPSAIGRQGKVYTVKSKTLGSFSLIVATTSSQLIDGQASLIYTASYECHAILSDGANWLILN